MTSATVPSRSATTNSQRQLDPNAPQNRLFLNQQCIYERALPGDSYITAHVTRLQSGYFDTPAIHEDCIDDVRFLAINFVFHPVDTRHRFVSARITLSVHKRETDQHGGAIPLPPQIDRSPRRSSSLVDEALRRHPKILRYAPHLLYGTLSPETLDWNFNLAGSLGVTQGPANASLQPSGGVKSSYKIYKMMKIQGSVRTLSSWYGRDRDVEDGELVWTLEENDLQKSGLPREFTFVVMLTKGHSANDVQFNIDIEPVVASWYGNYPKWWLSRIWYQPLPKAELNLDKDLGQKFQPIIRKKGFNFANIMGAFDDFVSLPGTTFSTSDSPTVDPPAASDRKANKSKPTALQQTQATQSILGQPASASPTPATPKDLNIRVFLEGYQPPVPATQTTTSPRTQSSHLSIPVQPISPLPDASFSLTKPRSRSSSTAHSQPPPTSSRYGDAKPRPVSTIYETSATPSPVLYSESIQLPRRQRPISNETDISEDLHVQSASPLAFDNSTPPISKPVRHRRSRSEALAEYGGLELKQQRNAPPEQSNVSFNRSNPSARKAISSQHPPGSFQIYNSDISSIHSTGSIIGPSKRSSKPSNGSVFLPPSISSPTRQHIPTAVSNANENSVHNNVTRSNSIPRKPNPNLNARTSFPPSSYPSHSMDSTLATTNPTTTNPSPPTLDVDNIVQREVDNFLKAHPELKSPVKNRSHGRNHSVSISAGSGSRSGSVSASGSVIGLYGEVAVNRDQSTRGEDDVIDGKGGWRYSDHNRTG